MYLVFFAYISLPIDRGRLQFESQSHHCGATAEGVVVGVGVDAVEEGVGVAALVEEVGEFQTEDALLPLVLRGGVEEGHALQLVAHLLLRRK